MDKVVLTSFGFNAVGFLVKEWICQLWVLKENRLKCRAILKKHHFSCLELPPTDYISRSKIWKCLLKLVGLYFCKITGDSFGSIINHAFALRLFWMWLDKFPKRINLIASFLTISSSKSNQTTFRGLEIIISLSVANATMKNRASFLTTYKRFELLSEL